MSNFANNLLSVLGAIGEAAIASKHFSEEEKDVIVNAERILRSKGHLEEADALKGIMERYYVSSSTRTTETTLTSLTPYEKTRKLEKAFKENGFEPFKGGLTKNYGDFNITMIADEIRIHRKGYREQLDSNNIIAVMTLKDFHIYNVEKTNLYAEQRSWLREEYDTQIETIEKIVSSCR